MQTIAMHTELPYLPVTCAGSISPGKDLPTKAAPDPPKKKAPKKK